MKTKFLAAALAAAVSLTGFTQSATAAIVIDNSVSGTVTHNFSGAPTGALPGTLSQPGATYGESFVGQTVSGGNGVNDTVSGAPSAPLVLQANPSAINNIAVLNGFPLVYGPSGNLSDAGGAVSVLFDFGTDILGFTTIGADTNGVFTVAFFNQFGASLGSVTQSTGSGFFGFRADMGELIAGVTITSVDVFGIGYDNVTFNQIPFPQTTIPEPGVLALFGLALAGGGIVSRRRREE